MRSRHFTLRLLAAALAATTAGASPARADETEPRFKERLDVVVPHISTDAAVDYDYDIVYVRARRAGDKTHKRFYTDFSQPVTMEPGADLMLLRPDGSEELLVEGGSGSITDAMIRTATPTRASWRRTAIAGTSTSAAASCRPHAPSRRARSAR